MNAPLRRVLWHTEAVFATMREIGTDAERLMERSRKLTPPYGTVAFGGGHMDYFLPANALDEFLRAVRRGYLPDTAALLAKAASVEAVRKWNRHRGDDVHTHRHEGHCDHVLDAAARKVAAAITTT